MLAVAVLAPHLARRGRVLLAIAVGLFAVAVGVSRVVLGVHYPSDVVAGAAIGVGLGEAIVRAIAPTLLR